METLKLGQRSIRLCAALKLCLWFQSKCKAMKMNLNIVDFVQHQEKPLRISSASIFNETIFQQVADVAS